MRRAFLVALVLFTGGVALAACGGDSSSSSPETTDKYPTESVYPNIDNSPKKPTTPRPPSAPPPPTQADLVSVVVRDGKPVGGVKRARVKKGRPVLVRVRSNVADEIHIHGYDISREVGAGGRVEIPFTATIVGVFEVELEERHVPIGEIEVRP